MHRAIQADKSEVRESMKEAVKPELNDPSQLSDLTRNHSETVNKMQEEAKSQQMVAKSQPQASHLMMKQGPSQDFG
jgi:hypothetical protein